MTLTLYSSTAEKNRLDKASFITQITSMTGSLTEPSSLIDPVIIIETTSPYFNASNETPVNYAYIPDFGRYYFIRNIVSVATGLWRIEMHCDVLMSYKAQILQCTGYLARTSTTTYINRMIVDPQRIQTGGIDIKTIPIGTLSGADAAHNNNYLTYATMLIGRK